LIAKFYKHTMADIKLTCLIREKLPEDAFEIEIGKIDTVYYLKEIIIKKIPKKFIDDIDLDIEEFITDPRFLKLWKVNISINEKKKFEQLKNHTLSIKEILGGEEITSKYIDYYFSDDMLYCKDFIHIIVDLPIGIDKNLGKSWDFLRNGKVINIKMPKDHSYYQFISLSKDVSYLLGNDNEEQFLLIRDCYHHLADSILNHETRNYWHIVGNPGVGLTYFSYYLLYRLAQQNKIVIYDSKDNECIVLFSKNYTLYYNYNILERYFLEYFNTPDTYYVRAIDIVDHNLLGYYGEIYVEKDIRYMLAHIFTNERNDLILQFASAYVSEKFVNKLEIYEKDKLIVGNYFGLHRAVFEYIAHRTLSNGGSFEIHPLFESIDNSKLTMSKREKLIISDIDDIEPDKYCIPSKKNFICDINAIVSPNMFFIFSAYKKYNDDMKDLELEDLELEKLIDKFIDKSDKSIIELYFVVPKQEKAIIKNSKNLPSLNDRLRQYVLELDLTKILSL
ncbi:4642_t:CDS:2, partial [Rhizophagus irregularis]